MERLLTWIGHVITGLLVVFAARRGLFLAAAASPARPLEQRLDELPSLLVVVAARDEERGIARTLEALDRIDYPGAHVTLVDDCSTDATLAKLRAYAETRPHVHVLGRRGVPKKAAALNLAIDSSPPFELVAVCDADQAPAPDCFRRLAAAFDEPSVGAAAAYLRPVNATSSVVSRYTAAETWVHQLVTSAAKDRLGLDPPMLGGGALYRREALAGIGGFPESAYAEDLEASLLLARAGWRSRFVVDAHVDNRVAAGWRDYWDQHLRWTRSLYRAAEPRLPTGGLSPRRRIEQALQTAGYVDRIVLGGAILLASAGRLRRAVPAGYLAILAAEVVVGGVKAGERRRLPRFLVATAVVFPVDALGTLVATAIHLARRPLRWRSPRQQA